MVEGRDNVSEPTIPFLLEQFDVKFHLHHFLSPRSPLPFLFPDLSHIVDRIRPRNDGIGPRPGQEEDRGGGGGGGIDDDPQMTLHTNLTFYLTSLNFYIFLLEAQDLHEPLDIPASLHSSDDLDVSAAFIDPLRRASKIPRSKTEDQVDDRNDDDDDDDAEDGQGLISVQDRQLLYIALDSIARLEKRHR